LGIVYNLQVFVMFTMSFFDIFTVLVPSVNYCVRVALYLSGTVKLFALVHEYPRGLLT
jgi:hypothetical protein